MRSALLAGLALLTTAMQEAPPPAPADDTIVVSGKRHTPAELRTESFDFVRRALGEPAAGQYARWNEPLCFAVTGLPPAAGQIVVRNMADVARDAGAVLAKGKCMPNVAVVFTDDARAVVAKQMLRTKWLFDETGPDERAILRDSSRAVRWWYATKVEGSDGRQQSHSSAALNMNPFGVVSNGRARYLSSDNPSIIDTNMRSSLAGLSAVVDVKAAEGVRLQALAQYLGFVTLSRTRMTADYKGASTILTLFDGGSPPYELTAWDKAYLAALYRAAPNRNAVTQRAQMAAEMTRRLGGR